MSFLDIATSLIPLVPSIGKLLTGEEAAETIVKTAQTVTGTNDLNAIKSCLENSPEHLFTLFRELEKITEQQKEDRANARMRDSQITHLQKRNVRADIMVLGALVGLVGCLCMLTFYKMTLSGEVIGIISTIAGIFGSCLKDAYAFEFGSSRGSREKESHLIELLGGLVSTKK